ncbi:MAG: SpoIIE family protein phosphatase [Bacteroidetes bacterium]|nr:SpoIIE family protein phosphatase [Bacteroidota bacterium]
MVKPKLIQFTLGLFLLPVLIVAQTYHFTNFSVKDGLAQSNVSGIVQDSAGFFWLATDGGVSRFDGKNFINYTTEDGLADNNVSAIYITKDQRLWLGHKNGMLTVYDGASFQQIKSSFLPKDKAIYSFYQDKAGSLWISTETGGVIKLITTSGKNIKKFSGKEGLSQYVFSTVEDKNGDFWFYTDIGLKCYDKNTNSFNYFSAAGMPLGQVTSLARDKNFNIYIGTMAGAISRYYPDTKKFEPIINPADVMSITHSGINPILPNTIYEDRQGNLWASVQNIGVIRHEKETGKLTLFSTANGLVVNKIKSIYEDIEGNILFGTVGEGFEIYSGERFVSFSKNNGVVDNQVWAICQDYTGQYWFGTNGGISIFNPKEDFAEQAYKKITTAEGLPAISVRAIAKDKNQNMWIATWGGKVIKYDMQAKRLVSVSALNDIVFIYVSCLLVDSKNNLWIGTPEGIIIYGLDNGSIKPVRTIDGLSDNDISCLFEDSKGRVWVGTKQKGVTLIDKKTFKIFNRENGLNYTSVSSIAEDKNHNIWVGTEGGGAFVYNGKTFTNYKTKNGLVSDYITLITTDKQNNVWIGTNKGLSKYIPEQNTFVSYHNGDGFTGVETKPGAAYNDSEGNIWFGTVNGAFKYSPKSDIPVSIEPITKLLSFKVNLNDYPVSDKVKLSYTENTLNFDFVSISLSNPEGVTYKIKMEGYDKDWRQVKQTNETYANLSPGHYELKLAGCNSSGVCNSNYLTMKIEIVPPFWQTWWFWLIVLVSLGGGVLLYIRKLNIDKKKLEAKVQERTAEVVKQKHIIEEKHKEITDSINYAERIQKSFLATKETLDKNLSEYFVLFRPKDVVSGDFYWAENLPNGNFVLATADSTGHGVPGAIMSLLNIMSLEKATEHIIQPAEILNHTRINIINRLKRDGSPEGGKDGMDCSLCVYSPPNPQGGRTLWVAAANNPVWIVRAGSGELEEAVKPDKMPVGKHDKQDIAFTQYEIDLQKGDIVYSLTDGFPDQFGGERGKKFMSKNLRKFLKSNARLPMHEQCLLLEKTFLNWLGNLEQIDDVTVIGVKI